MLLKVHVAILGLLSCRAGKGGAYWACWSGSSLDWEGSHSPSLRASVPPLQHCALARTHSCFQSSVWIHLPPGAVVVLLFQILCSVLKGFFSPFLSSMEWG